MHLCNGFPNHHYILHGKVMKEPWYKNGLRFKCTGCGQCCTGAPGYVWIEQKDILAIAKLLNISEELFIKKYTRQIGDRLSLKEDPNNFDCIFLKERKCLIYDERPHQCKAFPWWKENLRSQKDWKKAAECCEGINHSDAPLVKLGEINLAMEKE
jgi:Fe-S-cluster containining protein